MSSGMSLSGPARGPAGADEMPELEDMGEGDEEMEEGSIAEGDENDRDLAQEQKRARNAQYGYLGSDERKGGEQKDTDNEAVYFAPMTPHIWHLYLPIDWSTYLEPELKKRHAKHDSRLSDGQFQVWEVRLPRVAGVLDLLQREGLRGTAEEPTVDEVLATITPHELREVGGYGLVRQTLPQRVAWLRGLGDYAYGNLLERARRRMRPEIQDALAALSEDQLRWLVAQPTIISRLPTARRHGHYPGPRAPMAEVEAALTGILDSPEELNRLLAGYRSQAEVRFSTTMEDNDLASLAYDIYPALRLDRLSRLPRAELEAIVDQEFDRLPAATQERWLERIGQAAQQKAEFKAKAKAKTKQSLQEKAAVYRRNQDLYPYFTELKGMVVPAQKRTDPGQFFVPRGSGDEKQWEPILAEITSATIERRPPRPEDRSNRSRWVINIAWRDMANGDDEPAYIDMRHTSWRTDPTLTFGSYGGKIDLEPALRQLLWRDHRHVVQGLRAVLPTDLVRYVGRAV